MIKKVKFLCALTCMAAVAACSNKSAEPVPEFVRVENGEFMLGNEPYRYVGTNFWYGTILASPGEGGDRARLEQELDSLQSIGIDNLRILVGGDGNEPLPCHIEPTLQKEPGIYDTDLLTGLDYLLESLEQRGMKAVLYLNNSWEWSGGYGTYLEWAGKGPAVIPQRDGYSNYMRFASQFVTDSVAKELYANHVRNIVSRTNSITGKPYAESPAIMSWQIANEPRCFDPAHKEVFKEWLIATGTLIKSIDPNHLVSTGSEGKWGCEGDIELWAEIHNDPAIDYANIHIWPYNWRWVSPEALTDSLPNAFANTREYVESHRRLTSKPLVLEEFGFPRDSMAIEPGSPTTARDAYYKYVFDLVEGESGLNGVNFWAWGGNVTPPHSTWESGDPYTGDPAQEDQGLNSVFMADSSTIALIRSTAAAVKKQKK